jgi:serine phosphatase RsbU (regulator of sigma subunit)
MKFVPKILFAIIWISACFISCNKPDKPFVRNGYIDVSSKPLSEHKTINLKGEWEFYRHRLLEPSDFDSGSHSPAYLLVPRPWNNSLFEGLKMDKYGYGTYRLKIKTNPVDSIFCIQINRIDVAYKFWINGELVNSSGEVGTSRTHYKPKWSNFEKIFKSKLREQELVIQVSNFSYTRGGIAQKISFSDETNFQRNLKKGISADFLLLGIMIIIAIYHVILFLLRRVVVSSFYFAVIAIIAAAILAFSKNFNIVYLFWPEMTWGLHFRLEYVFYFIALAFLVLFISSLFERETRPIVVRSLVGFCSLMTVFVVVSPVSAITPVMSVADWFFILIVVYLLQITIKALVKGSEGSGKSLIGLSLLILAIINDVALNKYFANSYFLLPFGFLGFLLIQAYIISSKFTQAINYSEQLTEEMDYLNNNLENLVKERTAKIEQQKEELEMQSESLKVANDEIVKINHILERQGGEMNKKNKALTDSLNYAKRLQGAVMPDENYLKQVLPEHFIFFQPKDIVSGDFYWYGEVDTSFSFDESNLIQVLIVADCTGHGVPGAFMTLLGHNFLNVTVKTQEVTDPEQIIQKLDQQVVETLRQEDPNSIRDGMDIAVLSINQESKQISFSGAGIPLLHMTNGEILEIKGSNFGIGGVMRKGKEFFKHKIEYEPGDTFYMLSDGYADQIGGKDGRKYYKKRFKEFLLEIKDHSMEEQKKLIETEFHQWKGDYKQIDDILIIGLRM